MVTVSLGIGPARKLVADWKAWELKQAVRLARQALNDVGVKTTDDMRAETISISLRRQCTVIERSIVTEPFLKVKPS